jgi:methylthioribulose-1-phosphate dehydratase
MRANTETFFVLEPSPIDAHPVRPWLDTSRLQFSGAAAKIRGLINMEFAAAAEQLATAGRRFDARNWVLGTSGNLSIVVNRQPLRIAITRSGIPKGDLTADAIVEIDEDGKPVRPGDGRPSAEARLHIEIARARGAGSVLHTHSIWSTVLSARHLPDDGIAIDGYEMLKGLEGVPTHEHREWIPILENEQNMTQLAERVRHTLEAHPACHAFLLHRHGLYTWGETLPQAVRHVEIVEFLLEAVGRTGD